MKKFFKDVFRSLLVTLVSSLLFFIVIVALWAGVIGALAGKASPLVPDGAFLVLDLNRSIPDAPPQLDPFQALDQLLSERSPTIHLYDLIRVVRRAQQDEKIGGIFMVGNLQRVGYGSSYAAVGELRSVLSEFGASGKPVLGYLEGASQLDYFLYSVSTRLVMNPFGGLELTGIATQSPFFIDALEKLGIGAQVIRVGDFKSAVEPFFRSDMSEENRAQSQLLIDSLWEGISRDIADARELDVESINRISDTYGFVGADRALELGLVDELAYFDEVLQAAGKMGEPDEEGRSFVQIAVADYLEALNAREAGTSRSKARIAVVYAEGDIVDGDEPNGDVPGAWLARKLRDLRFDETVHAVVLRINSPGGSAYASEVIRREMELLQNAIPVVVSMGGLGASGGYWIAANHDYLFVDRYTITGSIGVFGLLLNFQETGEKLGVAFDGVQTNALGGLFSGVRPKTDAELQIFQASVDDIYDRFLERVLAARPDLERSELEAIASGRVWTGQQAVDLKLADAVGGLESAIGRAAQLADLGVGDYRVEEFPEVDSPDKLFRNLFLGGRTGLTPIRVEQTFRLGGQAGALADGLDRLRRLEKQGNVLALSPIVGVE